MQCEAQSAPFSSAKQAICNDAMRPKMARQKYKLLLCEPLYGWRPRRELCQPLAGFAQQLTEFDPGQAR